MKLHLLLLIGLPFFLIAQEHEPVFPNLTGNELILRLQDSYTPDSVLSYGMGRDTLFRNIDSSNDTLYGIYSRHSVYLPPNEDPTVAAFMNGSANGINTEHAWPRSKGASRGNAESDLHHLYPSRTPVNSDRASLPFGEVNDSQTLKWYRYNRTENQIPNNNIDEYSELGNNYFEPREAVKGDIARSMFYFYTIYREEADAEDPDFFELQRADLCTWHLADEVDSREWERNQQIASYQSGKANPFILDCTLAHRTYCQEYSECKPLNSTNPLLKTLDFQLYPNPASDVLVIDEAGGSRDEASYVTIRDLLGKVVMKASFRNSGTALSIGHLPEGIYIVILSKGNAKGVRKLYVSHP